MARVDDYINAKKIAAEELSKQSFDEILQRSGFEAAEDNIFRVPFLDRIYRIGFPDFDFQDEAETEKQVPIQEQVLILHYMLGDAPSFLSGKWIAYREINGASFYFSSFVKRAIDPLKQVFGNNIPGFVKAAKILKGSEIEAGDGGFEFKLFPKVPVQLILWGGDDEFAPEANILFDETVSKILSPEDAAWLAGMIVYRLMALSR